MAPLIRTEPSEVEALGADGCRYTGVRFSFLLRFGYEAASLTERGIPSEPSDAPGKPLDVQVEARGIILAISSGDRRTDWLSRQQQVPFDVTVDGSYDPATGQAVLRKLAVDDPATGQAVLRKLAVDGPALGHTSLAVAATGLDLAAPERTGLSSLQLHLDSRRFLVTFALSPLVALLPGDDPGGAVDRAKAQAVAAVRAALPASGASAETVDAIAGFIADFPHPQHVLDLGVTTSTPVTVAAVQAAMNDPAQATALLRTLTITASYAGDPH